MAQAISKGNRFQLSKAITLIESTRSLEFRTEEIQVLTYAFRDESRAQGQEVLDRLLAIKSEGVLKLEICCQRTLCFFSCESVFRAE